MVTGAGATVDRPESGVQRAEVPSRARADRVARVVDGFSAGGRERDAVAPANPESLEVAGFRIAAETDLSRFFIAVAERSE
jgi:hypothetical protein